MFKQQLYFQSMLDWCRNLQPHEEHSNELTLIAGNPVTQPNTTRNSVPPKFVAPNERRLNSDIRRGIKTHFSRVAKLDKQTQTIQKENSSKFLKDCGTQTGEIVIHSLGSKRNSNACSRHQSPVSKLEKTNILKVDVCATERTNFLEVSKGTLTVDYKNQLNRETKASYNMLESQEKAFRLDDRSYQQVRNIESYHISNDRPKNQPLLSVPTHLIMRNKMPHRQMQLPAQRMVQSIRNTINQQHDQNTFSQKYKHMMQNVESEFKLSEKKHSQRKIRFTPEKRILFHDRQTIVSKYGESYQEERSLRVEESLVYDRDVRAFFTNLGKLQAYDTFVMFLALQNVANVAISIKQVSVRHMNAISEELLIYREMEEKRLKLDTILQLYQTQIDRDSYLFIKQAYTDTLRSHIQTNNGIFSIESQARDIFINMQQRGFTLKTFPKVQDFVFCFDILKVQNPGIFQFDQKKKIEIQSALLSFKDQMLQQLI